MIALSPFVSSIFAARKSDITADTSALEKEIDERVFGLYGLTRDEREIVKGNGKTSRTPLTVKSAI